MNKKSNDKGLSPMKNSTRLWFLARFGNSRGGIDYEEAAQFCCVKPRTVRYWWTTSCPPWIDRLAHLASRAIPDSKPWREYSFDTTTAPELLVLPSGKTLGPGDLYLYADNLDLMREYRVKTEKAAGQLEAVRSEEEAAAICAELDHLVRSIEKLKLSPILTRTGKYNEPVAKAKGRADKSGVAVSRKK